MLFNHKYKGQSAVRSKTKEMGLSFAPDVLREPTFFVGELYSKLNFREAISALHDVVVADFKFRPSDKTDYKEWLAEQEQIWLAEAMAGSDVLERKIKEKQQQLTELRTEKAKITGPYYKAQREYFNYLYKRDHAAWYVLDPVITIHPDQLFFECFSKDESAYGKLSCSHNVFKNINEFECGTTNIDYSKVLYDEFQKIRSYKETSFVVDPKGFEVQTGEDDSYKEVKIDLPDSWVRGFLQVSTTMTMDQVTFDLHPSDLANFLFILKRNRERHGPRSIRYILNPGEPVEAVFEPWNHRVKCHRSVYQGQKSVEIRVWGRRRLMLLERLLPVAKKFTIHLMGTGMPSFYIADLGDMDFTLGLSGWSANDWTGSSRLNLLAPRGKVDSKTMQEIYLKLRSKWFSTAAELASELKLNEQVVQKALTTFTQAGKVIYDLTNQVYRARELKKEGIDLDELRYSSEVEKTAYELVVNGQVGEIEIEESADRKTLRAEVEGKHPTHLIMDKDERIVGGYCSCSYYFQNKLMKGPCEHMIALRLKASS